MSILSTHKTLSPGYQTVQTYSLNNNNNKKEKQNLCIKIHSNNMRTHHSMATTTKSFPMKGN